MLSFYAMKEKDTLESLFTSKMTAKKRNILDCVRFRFSHSGVRILFGHFPGVLVGFFSDQTNCGYPEQPLGGVVTVEGGVAYYSCDEGYVLHGGDSRYCQKDGLWSGEVPLCLGSI